MENENIENGSSGQGGETDAGSFGGGNEGAQHSSGPLGDDKRPAGSESATAGSGETGTVGGPHGGADDIGRSGTGSAMTGQTSILSDEK